MSARLLLLSLVLSSACRVPYDAGFSDVQRHMKRRGIASLAWHREAEADEKVRKRLDELIAKELTLASAVEIALLNNRHLQATFNDLGIAQADLVQAGLIRNPTIFGHAGFSVGAGASPGVAWEVAIATELIDLFTIPLRKRFARAEFERTKLEVADAVIGLIAEVKAAYAHAVAAHHIEALRETVLAAADAALELADKQRAAGTMSDLDATLERANAVEARVELQRQRAESALAREKLLIALGLWGRHTAIQLTAPLAELPAEEESLEEIERLAVSNRLDLAAQRQQIATLAAALGLTKAMRYFGSVEVGGDAHREPEGVHIVGPSLSIELPIFDQGQAKVARGIAQLRAAQQRYYAHAVEVRSEARQARVRITTARAIVEQYRTALIPVREQVVAFAQEQYNAMLLGAYQLLAAKQSETQAYRAYIEALRDYWVARAELERRIGGHLKGDQ